LKHPWLCRKTDRPFSVKVAQLGLRAKRDQKRGQSKAYHTALSLSSEAKKKKKKKKKKEKKTNTKEKERNPSSLTLKKKPRKRKCQI